jgi:hypothetical protein
LLRAPPVTQRVPELGCAIRSGPFSRHWTPLPPLPPAGPAGRFSPGPLGTEGRAGPVDVQGAAGQGPGVRAHAYVKSVRRSSLSAMNVTRWFPFAFKDTSQRDSAGAIPGLPPMPNDGWRRSLSDAAGRIGCRISPLRNEAQTCRCSEGGAQPSRSLRLFGSLTLRIWQPEHLTP